jgi:glycosyltransferase involved in cell wall biosynthesis
MRIVFVSWRDLAHAQAGGSEVVVDHLASGLQARGHTVTLLSGGPVGERDYHVVATGGTYSQYARAPLAFRRQSRGADVIVDVENGIPFFAPIWQRAPVVCLVHHIHTEQWAMQFSKPMANLGRWLESTAMPRAYRRAWFAAVSPSTRDGLVELGIDEHRIQTIEMGCTPVPTRGPRSPTPRFLVLSRLVPHKRVELALQMWEHVRPHTGGELVIVGDGPELDRLQAMAGADVEFTGHLTLDAKGNQLGSAWVLIHPAHHEGWGTVVMEAAAAGVPTVAFDVPGVRDSIVDGVTGILAPDEQAFIDAWIGLVRDADARKRMSAAGKQRAATFTWDRAVDEFEALLREACGS